MRQKVITYGRESSKVYLLNIPEKEGDGVMATHDKVIFDLQERLDSYKQNMLTNIENLENELEYKIAKKATSFEDGMQRGYRNLRTIIQV